MATTAVKNPPAPTEAKASKKKKAKVDNAEASPPAASTTPEKAASSPPNDANLDDPSETPYMRELAK